MPQMEIAGASGTAVLVTPAAVDLLSCQCKFIYGTGPPQVEFEIRA